LRFQREPVRFVPARMPSRLSLASVIRLITNWQSHHSKIFQPAPVYGPQLTLLVQKVLFSRFAVKSPMEMTIRQAWKPPRASRAGRFQEAEAIYRSSWHPPDQPDALDMLGVVISQRGQHQEGLELIDRHRLRPRLPITMPTRRPLFALGQVDAAVAAFRQAIALRPAIPKRWSTSQCAAKPRPGDDAISFYRQALPNPPSMPMPIATRQRAAAKSRSTNPCRLPPRLGDSQ